MWAGIVSVNHQTTPVLGTCTIMQPVGVLDPRQDCLIRWHPITLRGWSFSFATAPAVFRLPSPFYTKIAPFCTGQQGTANVHTLLVLWWCQLMGVPIFPSLDTQPRFEEDSEHLNRSNRVLYQFFNHLTQILLNNCSQNVVVQLAGSPLWHIIEACAIYDQPSCVC